MVPYYVKDEGWFFDHKGQQYGPYDTRLAAQKSYQNLYRGCDSCED